MPKVTILFALALIGLGLFGYFGASQDKTAAPDEAAAATDTDGEEGADAKKGPSKTALIPAFFGLPLLLCGLIALSGGKPRMHAMHVAAMIGVLGAVAGLGRGLMVLAKLLGGAEVNQRAMAMTLSMGTICAVFTVVCVQSFIAARKAREATAKE